MAEGIEEGLCFACGDAHLVGILHRPAGSGPNGVLIVVGGPQYRVGSHRQFVLLARDLAAAGIPVLRFDHRGLGDSRAELRDFDDLQTDIRAAVDAFHAAVPGLREVTIWGLCDAATAGAFYAPHDERIGGLVLLNPWVRSESGEAKAYLKHYYLQRLASPEFWGNLLRLRWRPVDSLKSLAAFAAKAVGGGRSADPGGDDPDAPLALRMLRDLQRFDGRVLLILSGRDLTAQEFKDEVARSKEWQEWLRGAVVARRDLPEADHTFSRRDWRNTVSTWTREWVQHD